MLPSWAFRGWIVEQQGATQVVTFYGGSGSEQVAYYVAHVDSGRVTSAEVFPVGSRPVLTPLQRRLAKARDVAVQPPPRRCEDAAFNTVVIPPAEMDDPIDVYFLTPQLRDGEWPAGGHYRITVAEDGRILSNRAFTNTCITLGGGRPSPDVELSSLLITHVLDPIPTEIHVFTMWTSRLPLAVATGNPERLWWLSSDGILLHGSQEERRAD